MVRNFLWLFLVVVFVPNFNETIYAPGDSAVKKQPQNFGLKTLQWQNQNGDGGDLQIHHNYSKVNIQKGVPDDPNSHHQNGGETFEKAPILEVSKTHQPIVTYFPKKPRHTEAYAKCPKMSTGQFAYEFSCNQFLSCWKGHGHIQNCPPGTLFNPKTLECDHAEKVECVSGPRNTPEGTFNGKIQANCPRGFSGLIPHYGDCTKFFSCTHGGQILMTCPPGTNFDVKTNTCDFPEKSTCVGSKKGRSTTDSSDKNSLESVFCGGVIGVFAHPRDCSKYFNCTKSGEEYVGKCVGGLFNHVLRKCDLAYNVNCGVFDRQLIPTKNTQGTTVTNQNSRGFKRGYNSDLHDQRNHGLVQGQSVGNQNYGQGVHAQIDTNSNLGGSYQNTQNYGGGASTVPNPGGSLNQPGLAQNSFVESVFCGNLQGIFAHPKDCTKYFNCTVTGGGFVVHCPNGFGFNHLLNRCDLVQNVNCGASDRVYFNHNQNFELGVEPKCPQYAQGLYPHPGDCAKFLNCANGMTFIQDCAPGTLFNGVSKICDFPANVNCANENLGQVQYGPQQGVGATQNVPSLEFGQSQYLVPTNQGRTPKIDYQNQNLGGNQNGYSQFLGVNHNGYNQNLGANYNGYSQILGANYDGYSQNLYPITTQAQPTYQSNSFGQNFDQNPYYQRVDLNKHQNWGTNKYPQNTPLTKVQVQNPLSVGQQTQHQHPQNGEVLDQNLETFDQIPYPTNTERVQTPNQTPQKSKQWPPPFPSTDVNADYAFDSEDDAIPLESTFAKNGTTPNKECQGGPNDCPTKYLGVFQKKQNTKLAVREKTKIRNTTLGSCAKFCAKSYDFQCKSFSFRRHDGLCLLSDLNIGLSGMLIRYHPFDYYEHKKFSINCTRGFKCPNDKCVDKDQICDGQDDCGDRTDEKNCSARDLGYEIRLGGSHFDNEGRIEVTVFGRTGYVCDDNFGMADAEVACRELGFPLGAVEVKGHSYFAGEITDNDTFFMMDDVTCLGNESSLRDCDFNGWGVHNCLNQEIVGVVCKTPLEQCPDDYWKCDSSQECLPLAFVCDGVQDCTDGSDESDPHCEAPIELRLVNGTTPSEGRIEINYHGTWGTICDDDFNEDAAKVVCKYFGYRGTATVRKDGFYGPGKGPIWLDQVYCQGNESYLQDCTHWNWGEHNCEHSEDVGVVCSNYDISGSERKAKVEVVAPIVPSGTISDGFKPKSCGLRNDDLFTRDDEVHFRVIKGTTARKGEYPWQASIRVKGKSKPAHWCGAVVISNKFLLTAAHCLIGFSKGAYLIVAGDYNVDDEEGTEQQAYIEDFYIHEDFRKEHRMNNDIALIKLKGPGFVLTKDIQPICLPDVETPYDKDLNCTISGFGSIQSGKSAYSHDLRAGWIPIQSEDVCKMPHIYGSAITPGMFCAGSLDEGVDACDGDSGGPLACLREGLFTLYGLTSWGQHCGHANKPGVYVKISHYRKWIDETIEKHR